MPDADFDRLQDLFYRAIELEGEELTTFLDQHCGGEAERALLVRMLEADNDPPKVFSADSAQLADSMMDDTPKLPERVGPYLVDRLIGRGGMGVVVLADDVELRRKVALKLLRDRWFGSEAARRFKREQVTLARLQHPNIARLLDAGSTEDGTPYLTMDFVEGVPITEYFARRPHAISDKIELFVEVCEAVRYAHQNLVVHRDLKPSNILVDRDGHAKLLDFGIARLLAEDDDPATVTSNRMMTPAYASPEQLAGSGVSTSSDVYSLGVILFELLTGRRPHELEGKTATEALRVLNGEPAARPSSVVDGDSLRRKLRGDLDNVVLKALEADPRDRYASVEALLVDLRRYLDGFPVEAREASAVYRARKFVRRHRVGVGVAAGIAVLLVGFGVTVSVQQALTARERDRAEQAAARAERTTDFLIGLFEAADPSQALGDSVTAKVLLERGIEEAKTLGDPELQAETFDAVGRVYQSLGQSEQSIALLEEAVRLRRGLAGADIASTLRSLAEALANAGRGDEAVGVAQEAFEIGRSAATPPSLPSARGLRTLGVALAADGQFSRADSVLRLSHAEMFALWEEDRQESIQVLADRVSVLEEEGHHAAAEGLAREVLSWRRENLAANHPQTAEAIDGLAVILRNLARFDEAEPLYEEAVAIKRRVYGPSHPSTAASILNLAIFHGIQGHYGDAEPHFLEAVESHEAAFGPDSPRTARTTTMYAILLDRTGRFDEASMLYDQAFKIQRSKLGEMHPSTIGTQFSLGTTLCNNRRYDEGLPIVRGAVTAYREAMGVDNPRYADALTVLGYQEAMAGLASGPSRGARGLRNHARGIWT